MANSEILAALDSFRIHLESQFTATNSTIKACMQLVDSKFTDLLSTSPSPSPAEAGAPASSPSRLHSGRSSSAPQQRRLPTAPVQPPGSAAPLPFLSFDVTSAAASTSFSAAPPPSASPTPSPSAVFSLPSPPPSAASPSPSAIAFPPSVADSPLPLGSGAMLNRVGFAATVVGQIAAPPPFLSSDDTTTLYQTTGNADGKLGFVNIPGSPLPPPPEGTPPPILQFGPQPPPPPPQAHSTWPSPSNTKAQTFLNLEFTSLTPPNNKYQDDAAVASRRGVIFCLYALEEVYKDSLESPP